MTATNQRTGFDYAIARAKEQGHRDLQMRITTERRICRQLVGELLRRGLVLSVFDGGDYPVKRSSSRSAVMYALFSVDDECIIARHASGASHSTWRLVYGNDGDDVICDFGPATPETDEIYRVATRPA